MNKKQLKALQTKWYAKLKRDGFEDIEQTSDDKGYLKQYDNSYYMARYTPLEFGNKQEYYIKAQHFLVEHAFETEQEKQIWKLHSEGFSLREIAKIIKKFKKDKVAAILTRLKEVMLGNSYSQYN